MKDRPEEKGLLITVLFALMAHQRPYLKTFFPPAGRMGKNRPKKRVGPVLPLPGIGVEGPEEEAQFIFAQTLFQLSINGEKTPVGFSLFRFPPEGQEKTPFLFLMLFSGEVPAGGIKGHEIGLHLFVGLLVFAQGVKVFQQGIFPFFLLPVKKGPKGEFLLPGILAMGDQRP
jgi:hypothetical protein